MLVGLAIWILVTSTITAIAYVWDKRSAIKGRPRVPEKTLLALSLAGGWPGGLVAGHLVRHKTQKMSYRIQFALCVAVNILIVGLVLTRF